MFGTVVDKVQTLFSRSFLLGDFFPVLFFTVVNVAIAWFGLPGAVRFVRSVWPTDATSATASTAVLVAGLTILAFILVPLVPVFRSALEGNYLNDHWRKRLIAQCAPRYERMKTDRDEAARRQTELKAYVEAAIVRLQRANAGPCVVTALDRHCIDAARGAFDALVKVVADRSRDASILHRLPLQVTIEDAVDRLEAALEAFPMTAGETGFDRDVSSILDRLHDDLAKLLRGLDEVAYRALQYAVGRCRGAFVDYDPRPTPLANARAAIELYPQFAYDADFDFIWPRLRMVFVKDSAIATAVDLASTQLDFAVLSTVLFAATTLFWVPLLAFLGDDVLVYLIVAIVGPLMTVIFYGLVVETQKAFGEASVMAIDGLRFDLLKALHVPFPASVEAERRLWTDLQHALYSAADNVFYRHPKT